MIKWITDYLATGPYEQINESPGLQVLDVRDLVDKPGNNAETVRAKLEQAVSHIQRGEKILVCCDYGMSRSNAIAAGILSLNETVPFARAVGKVVESTGEQNIKLEVLSVVAEALGVSPGGKEKPTKDKRILVTGGAGFLGAALVARLKTNHYIYAPTRSEVDLETEAVQLSLKASEHEINCIVHLANPHIYNTNHA